VNNSDSDSICEGNETDGSHKEEQDQIESAQESNPSSVSKQYKELLKTVEDEEVVSKFQPIQSSVETLENELESAQNERNRIQSQLEQERSEFKNYRSQRDEKQGEMRNKALKSVFEELVSVRTNLTRALADDHDSVEGLRTGVRITLRQFDEVLEKESVNIIKPESGENVDGTRHEIIRRVESDSAKNIIVEVHEPGYEFSGELLEPAKVTVSK